MDKSFFLSGLECVVDGFVKIAIVSSVLMFIGWLVNQFLEYSGGVLVVVLVLVVVVLAVILVVWVFYCKYFAVDCGDCSDYVMCVDGGFC